MKLLELRLLFVALVAFLVSSSIQAQVLDSSFAFNGKNELSVPLATNTSFPSTQDHVVLSDGRIIVLTGANDTENTFRSALVGFTRDGQIDAAFGNGGFTYMTWSAPNSGLALSLAIQSFNGLDRLIVAGSCGGGCTRVEAYLTDGSADLSFGTGGSTTFTFGSSPANVSVAVQGDQTILIGGGSNAVVKLDTNGTRNGSFFATSSGVYIQNLKTTADGKFLAVGSISGAKSNDFAVARFLSSGKLDTSFGKGGKVAIDFAKNNDIAIDAAVDSTGRILVCGEAQFGGSTAAAYNAVLVRFSAGGALDSNFASGGKAALDIGGAQDEYSSIAIQSDGKIFVVGEGRNAGNAADVLVARYNTNGSLDPTFNGTGWSLTDFYGAYDHGAKGVLQFDPACGCQTLTVSVYVGSGATNPSSYSVGLLRYLP